MTQGARVLLYITDESLMRALAEDLRRAGYLVDRCVDLETCHHVTSYYDHDIAFLQAEDDDPDAIQEAASSVAPGARTVVVLREADAELTERLEMMGMQVARFPRDSAALVDLLDEGE